MVSPDGSCIILPVSTLEAWTGRLLTDADVEEIDAGLGCGSMVDLIRGMVAVIYGEQS